MFAHEIHLCKVEGHENAMSSIFIPEVTFSSDCLQANAVFEMSLERSFISMSYSEGKNVVWHLMFHRLQEKSHFTRPLKCVIFYVFANINQLHVISCL